MASTCRTVAARRAVVTGPRRLLRSPAGPCHGSRRATVTEEGAPEALLQPDVNLARAARRLVSRSALSAGMVSGLLGAAIVTAGSALLALLFWAAHIHNGCIADVPASRSS